MDVSIFHIKVATEDKREPGELTKTLLPAVIPSMGNLRCESNVTNISRQKSVPLIKAHQPHPDRIRIKKQTDLPERLSRSASDFVKQPTPSPLKPRSKQRTSSPYYRDSSPYSRDSSPYDTSGRRPVSQPTATRSLRPRSSNTKPKKSPSAVVRAKLMKQL